MVQVLVADDEPLFVQGLEMFLQAEGYTVQTARSAEEATARFQASVPDVFITDFALSGGKSGTDLARQFQSQVPRLHVIVISGFPESTVRAESDGIANLQILTKPVQLKPLKSYLEERCVPSE